MLVCPVCQASNHHLTTICTSCGSFIQQKVDNIDLFSTVWKLIESPRYGFKIICFAVHKNYTLILSALSGIAFLFGIFWMLHAGIYAESLLNILSAGFIVGPVFGILAIVFMTAIVKCLALILRMQAAWKNIFSVIAYAMVPLSITVIVVLPIELLTFGMDFFMKSSIAYTQNPVSFITLIGFDACCVVWSIMLLMIGFRVLYDTSRLKSFLLTIIMMIVFISTISMALIPFLPKPEVML